MPIRITAIVLASLLTGCTSTMVVAPACSVLHQVSFNAQLKEQRNPHSSSYHPESALNEFDTDATVAEIRKQNAAIKSLCP